MPAEDKTISELELDVAAIDVEMETLREQKEAIVASLRALARQRDAINEPLERKRAVERMTKPVTVIGL